MTHSSSRTPSLRRTVLTMLMLGLLLLTAMQYLLAGNFFERQLQEIESKDAFARLRNLHHALEMLGEDLAATTTDWSQWDSAYDYTTHRYDAFATDNLSAGTIARLRLSFFIVIDQDGRPLFAKSPSADGTQLVDAPADIVRMASGTGVLSGSIEPLHHLTGLVATSSGVYLVSSQPVRTSMPGAPPRGRVVMGRSLNKFVAPALKRMTDEELEVQPVGADGLDDAADDEVYRRHDRDTLLVQGRAHGDERAARTRTRSFADADVHHRADCGCHRRESPALLRCRHGRSGHEADLAGESARHHHAGGAAGSTSVEGRDFRRLVHWKKVACGAFFGDQLRSRRQKAWFLPG